MERSVLVFHIGRSGSRVLGKLLGQHPDIGWEGEALKRPSVEAFQAALEDPGSYDTYAHLATLSDRREKAWLGVEVKFFHLRQGGISLDAFLSRVEEMGCRHFVVLERRNFLRKIVSSMVAKQTRLFHREAGAPPQLHQIEIDTDKVEIDAESKPLLEFLDDYRQSFENLKGLLTGRETLDLSYEDDICDDPKTASSKVCRFLGLPPHSPEIPFGRTNPFPLVEIVKNLDAVSAYLDATRYRWMTD